MLHYTLALKLSALLLLSTLASAQPWQWERYEGDYRNPTGFPQQGMWIGDFDGNGVDEMLCRLANGFDMFSLDSPVPPLHWSKYSGNQFIGSTSAQWVSIVNLDSDPSDELLMFEDFGDAQCWKAISSSPWTWEQRDELLAAFEIPESAISMAVGDFDGDELNEAVYTLAVECICAYIEIQEFDGSNWTIDTTFMEFTWINPDLFSGDFDNDGDTDLGMNTNFIDTHPFVIMIENTGSGLGLPVGIPRYRGYGGGDIDQDGEWEGMRRNLTWERGTREIIEWSGFGVIADSIDMTAFTGQILGNLVVNNENVIAGFVPWTRDTPDGYSEQTFWRYYSEGGWQDLDIGIPVDEGKTLSLGWGDLNGDGLPDMLREVQRFNFQVVPMIYVEWEIRLNQGNGSHNDFSSQTSTLEWLTDNPDTLLTNPQLGDFNRDGYADLFAIGQPVGSPSQVFIYRTDIERGLFLEPAWSLGLPSNVERIHTGDIDNDGLPELVLLTDSWQVFFFRNGRWQDYSDILPTFTSNDIGFADFDNDGNVDIFTDEDVWLSLSPSPASEDFILSPLSFILSAYPNPFNPTTTIRFDLPVASRVVLDVFNINGQKVQSVTDKPYTGGAHTLTFDGSSLASGLYFARLQADQQIKTTKLMLVK